MALLLAEERFLKIKQTMREEQNQPGVMKELLLKLMDDLQKDIQELMSKLLKDVRNISEEFSEYINCPSWNRPFSTSMMTMMSILLYGEGLKRSHPMKLSEEPNGPSNHWRRPKAITPILSTKEPVDSLIMEDEHLDTILATESDEVIKSSVENLVPIPSEFEGISEDTCDMPVCEDPSTFDALSDHSEILSDSNDDDISSNDDSYKNIEYVEASPLNLEYDSLEKENEDQEEKEFDLEDIFQIQDVILREKLLNVHRLITNIESLKNNPTPDFVFKSPSLFPIPVVDSDSFLEESDTSLSHLDNSLPEFETSSDYTEETRSGSTTTHANYSLPEYDSFLFDIKPDQGGLISIDNSNDPLLELPEFESFHFDPSFPRLPLEPPDVELCLHFKSDAPVINNFGEDDYFNPRRGEINIFENDDSFTFVIRTFLPFLTYPVDSPLLLSTGS
ncbi:hypothetical protein Tco_0756362 [Tanacetum coccineum]